MCKLSVRVSSWSVQSCESLETLITHTHHQHQIETHGNRITESLLRPPWGRLHAKRTRCRWQRWRCAALTTDASPTIPAAVVPQHSCGAWWGHDRRRQRPAALPVNAAALRCRRPRLLDRCLIFRLLRRQRGLFRAGAARGDDAQNQARGCERRRDREEDREQSGQAANSAAAFELPPRAGHCHLQVCSKSD